MIENCLTRRQVFIIIYLHRFSILVLLNLIILLMKINMKGCRVWFRGIVSTKGDVYSYGNMLMETFVTKKPTDEMFLEEVTLKTWLESSLSPNNIMGLQMPVSWSQKKKNILPLKQACFSSITALAMDCTVETPERRINMRDVVIRLKKILNQMVDVRTS